MGNFDDIFNSEETISEKLTSEEAVAAIAIVTAQANFSDMDAESLENDLWEVDLFADYSASAIGEVVSKLSAIAESKGLGALFKVAIASLSDELVSTAFSAATIMLMEDEGLADESVDFLIELQHTLGIEDEEAQDIIDEILENFSSDELEASDTAVAFASAAEASELDAAPEWNRSPQNNFRNKK